MKITKTTDGFEMVLWCRSAERTANDEGRGVELFESVGFGGCGSGASMDVSLGGDLVGAFEVGKRYRVRISVERE